MENRHELMGGEVQLFRRPNSKFWYCQASIGGKQRRMSTKKSSLPLAEDVAKDWFLTLQGKSRAGLLKTEKSFREVAEVFEVEYTTITEGQRSPKWVEGHKARLRLHLIPYFGEMGVSEINEGTAQEYRVHRIKMATEGGAGVNGAEGGKGRKSPAARKRGSQSARKAGPGKSQPATDDPEKKAGKPPARSTLHDEITTLRMVLKTAIRHRWLKHLPDLALPYNTQGKVVHRPWFSPEEYKQLYTATRENARNPSQPQYKWHAEQLHDYVLFLGNTGLRTDEAVETNLLHRDVQIVNDEVTGQRILLIQVRGKRGYGVCKSMPGAVRPYERLLNRPKPTRGKQKRNRSKKHPNAPLPVELPQLDDPVFPGSHLKAFNTILDQNNLKYDRDGKPRTAYSLRHTYICLRLMEGADVYQIAKNCRTSVEVIEKHYARHIANTIDTAAINVSRSKAAKAADLRVRMVQYEGERNGTKLSPTQRMERKEKARSAVRVPAAELSPSDLTSEN